MVFKILIIDVNVYISNITTVHKESFKGENFINFMAFYHEWKINQELNVDGICSYIRMVQTTNKLNLCCLLHAQTTCVTCINYCD